jgi:hypothetical protein
MEGMNMSKIFCMYSEYNTNCPHIRTYKKYGYRPVCINHDKICQKNDGSLITENCIIVSDDVEVW